MNGTKGAWIRGGHVIFAALLAVSVRGCEDCTVASQEQPRRVEARTTEHEHHGSPPTAGARNGKVETITGEPMCPACFLEAGSKSVGPGHFQCATDCAKSGQTLAIYDRVNDRIYFVAGELPGRNPNDPIMGYIHKNVDVTGTVYRRAGTYGIVILKVELHKEDASPPTPKG